MNGRYNETICTLCQPMDPISTGVTPKLVALANIRSVVFDVYGTMLISGSGDVGTSATERQVEAITQTMQSIGITLDVSPETVIANLTRTIREAHQLSREQGIKHPEVDILKMWQCTLSAVASEFAGWEAGDWEEFALQYELRVNPIWPMPGLAETLEWLRHRPAIMGIVSNAQFFTPRTLQALLGQTLEQIGFDPALTYFSFEHLQAKPGVYLYEAMRRQLAEQGVSPSETLYVGNDMLNDVMAAASVGFRTSLFAGDQRSLRWREGDKRVAGVVPDIIITELPQLKACLV